MKRPTSAKGGQMWGALVLIFACSWAAVAQTAAAPFVPVPKPDQESVRYIISLAKRNAHLVHVEARFPAMPAMSRDVQLPVWNALYQVRDFAQYVRAVAAHTDDGKPLAARAMDKTTWHVEGNGAFIFEYDIVADSPGPFGAQLNDQHAFFNLAEILVYAVGEKNVPVVAVFRDLPEGWKIASPMMLAGDGFTAQTYDQMVDSPVEIGTFSSALLEQNEGMW